MKTERKSRNLKGAVLFTVVSVLAILIIFMTCTLAMAAAANKRARKTYSTSQSSYTARTVIDSILASVAKDTTFSSAIHNLSEGQSVDLVVELNNHSMGSVDNVKVTNTGKKTFYDPDAKDWAQRNILEITADVTIGSETTTIKSSIIQDPPQPQSEGGGGAAFLTYGGDLSMGNFVSSWGGTYYGMGEWTKEGDTKADKWNNQLQYVDYNATDKFVSLANKEYWTNRSYQYKDVNNVEAPFVINGNFKVDTKLSIYLTYFASGTNNPGVQVWGDLDFKNGDDFAIRMAEHLEDDKDKINNFLSIPYLYVDGQINLGTQGLLGIVDVNSAPKNPNYLPFNIFCGSVGYMADGAGFNMVGDLYMMDAGKDSTLAMDNGTLLYKWVGSSINGTNGYSSQGGNLYSKGNVIFNKNLAITGDVRVEGDVILKGDVTIDGDLVVGGKIDIAGHKLTVGGDIYCGNMTGGLKAGYEEKTETVIPISGFTVDHGTWTDTPNNIFVYESEIEELGKIVPAISGKITVEDGSAVYSGDVIPEVEWNKIFPRLSNNSNQTRTYYVNSEGIEVPSSDAFESVSAEGMSIAGKTAKDVQKYIEANGPVYPERAEREVLMGVSWPVKGIEHRVVEAPDTINFADYLTYNSDAGLANRIINTTCTLTGEFTKTVTVKPNADETIYVRLMDVEFNSPKIKDADGNESPNNEAKIVVDESNGGKVYFVLDGTYVTSNYNYKTETADTKLLKTVYDWMDQFSLENKNEAPKPEPGPAHTKEDKDPNTFESTEDNPMAMDGKDIKLKGAWNETIYIKGPAKNGTLWVVLDKDFELKNGYDIIILDEKDGGTVKFYIKRAYDEIPAGATFDQYPGVRFWGNNKIVEKSFLDLVDSPGNIYMFSTDAYMDQMASGSIPEDRIYTVPKIKVFCEGPSKQGAYARMTLDSDAFMTAYVHAIDLDVNFKKGVIWEDAVDKIVYNGHPLKDNDPHKVNIGVVGMLDVRSIEGQNEWIMLYVDESNGKNPVVHDALGLHTYSAVEYYAYVN